MENQVKPGIYKHYKGNLYEVLAVARHTETEEELVVYNALYGERGTWVRPLAMFCENVEIDGVSAVKYSTEGIYNQDFHIASYSGNVYVFAGQYENPEDKNVQMYQNLISSITFR